MEDHLGEPTVLHETLRRLHEQGHLTVQRMADLLSISANNVYPYHSHRELTATKLRLLFRECGSAEAQRQLLDAFIGGTKWHAEYCGDDLDVDGDGDIDFQDALQSAARATGEHASYLQHLISSCGHEPLRQITHEQLERLEQLAHKANQAQRVSLAIARFLHEHTAQRRKARPLQPITAGGRGE